MKRELHYYTYIGEFRELIPVESTGRWMIRKYYDGGQELFLEITYKKGIFRWVVTKWVSEKLLKVFPDYDDVIFECNREE